MADMENSIEAFARAVGEAIRQRELTFTKITDLHQEGGVKVLDIHGLTCMK